MYTIPNSSSNMITFTVSTAVQEMLVWSLTSVLVSENASRDNPYIVISNSRS